MSQKIAIVEDDYLLALVMSKHLSNKGYECVSFPRAEDFFKYYTTNKDLLAIVLDIKLKGELTGIDIFNELSKETSLPVIFSTGNSDLKDLKTLNTPQVKGILIKPIILDQLSGLIASLN